MKNLLVLLVMVLIMLSKADAKVRIEGVEFETKGNEAIVTVNYSGSMGEIPSLQYKPDTVQLTVTDGVVWPQITKMVGITKGERDTKLMAYQYDKQTARIRTILPFNVESLQDKIQMDVLANKILLHIPIENKKNNNTFVSKKAVKEIDESYLNKLIDEKKIVEDTKLAQEDSVSTKLAGLEKDLPRENEKSKFSIMNYAGKFVAFLGIVLLFFYGIVNLFRKGATKKGRLSFLGSTKQVEVLSTTYIAPKKSLMMIKAHKQIFLVANSENGMNLISEIKDPAGMLKGEEVDIAGTNFDLNLDSANNDEALEAKVKIKENPLSLTDFIASGKENSKKDVPKKNKNTKDSFSEQLKKKVKELKPLQ